MIAPVSMLASHRAWGGARLPPAGGFLDAVALRPQAWKPLIEDHRAGILMAPLFLLNGDMEITETRPTRMTCWPRPQR